MSEIRDRKLFYRFVRHLMCTPTYLDCDFGIAWEACCRIAAEATLRWQDQDDCDRDELRWADDGGFCAS